MVQGSTACLIGVLACWWIINHPENAQQNLHFLIENGRKLALARIQKDRGDVIPAAFPWSEVSRQFLDLKVCGFAVMFFLLYVVCTALSYLLPVILQSRMGFTENQSILLSDLPYCYDVISILLSSRKVTSIASEDHSSPSIPFAPYQALVCLIF